MNTKSPFIVITIAVLSLLGYIFGSSYKPQDAGSGTASGGADTVMQDAMNGVMEVNFIDVGQGDCILVRLPSGKNMLVDAGNNGDIDKIKPYLDSRNVSRIDYLIGTHPHADHIGAMDDVIKNYDIGEIYMPKASADTKSFKDVLTAVSDKGLKINTAKSGMTIFDENGAKAVILAPCRSEYDELNNYSAVIRLSFGDTAFMLQGDAEALSEEDILKSGATVSADVLKAGHHGSSSSSSEKYVNAVNPRYAVISCGKDNDYGHPHREIKALFEKKGIEMLRTDTAGSIVFMSDGKNVSVR